MLAGLGMIVVPRRENAQPSLAMPEQPRDKTSADHGPIIERIIHALMELGGAEPLKKGNPDRKMEDDFPPAWRRIIRTQTDPAIDEKIDGQQNRDDEDVVQMSVKKGRIVMQVRLDHAAVQGINPAADQKYGIAPVTVLTLSVSRHRERSDWLQP